MTIGRHVNTTVLDLRHILIAAFLFASAAPLAVFWFWPRSAVLNYEVAEVEERHLLIARNLGAALETYHRDVIAAFRSFAPVIAAGGAKEAEYLFHNLHFRHVCVVEPETGRVVLAYLDDEAGCPTTVPPARLARFREMAEAGGVQMSGVVAPEGESPRIFLVEAVGDHLVVGAIHTTFFRMLQARISFGRKGHAAIVDANGHVLAHPQPEWADTARDLSSVSAVQRMMKGESGVATFHSPALQADMIAGFAAVPGTGWGVMVPQPLSELFETAHRIRLELLVSLVAGLCLSLAVALWIASRIVDRVARVETAALRLADGDHAVRVAEAGNRIEIRELAGLGRSFNRMAAKLSRMRETEEKMQRSQKMEALGQLTGGVAHDFNNLLQIIQGNAELLDDDGRSDRGLTRPIVRAARMGAQLTHQLLSFSRLQPLHPSVIDAHELVEATTSMLARTLGATVEIEIRSPADLWAAIADPSQLQSALLNLAINARDAMSGEGRMTIACENVRVDAAEAARFEEFAPGDYVRITVTDAGPGMPEEIRARAFEPFFTTKDTGKGSGLGLSMVYGFAKQSGGHVTIESQPGAGTSVHLFLPREGTRGVTPKAEEPAEVLRGQGETILVVEDTDGVREATARQLRSLGYRVLAARDARSGYRELEAARGVDLVLCDLILPNGESGPDFARSVRERFPDLKILFMSGLGANPAGTVQLFDWQAEFLVKPFGLTELARAIRAELGPAEPTMV